LRPGRAHRSLAPALPPCQPTVISDRDADRAAEAGQAELRRAKDQGKAGPAPSARAKPAISKGEFILADRRYYYPLTITDFASRYLFAWEALERPPLNLVERPDPQPSIREGAAGGVCRTGLPVVNKDFEGLYLK